MTVIFMITVLVTYFFCLFTTLKLIKYHTIIFALSEVTVVTDESSDRRQMDKIIYRGRFAPTNKYGSSVINTSVITVYAIVSTLIQ